MGGKTVDLTGARFGSLVVLGLEGARCLRTRWRCLCDCGRVTTPLQFALKQGTTKTCGDKRVHRKGVPIPANRTHGLTGTREHEAWTGMRGNCRDKRLYGGQTFRVDPRWDDFAVFLADMGPCAPNHELTRRNPLGDFEPGNCFWASRGDKANAHRANRMVTDEGRVETVAEFAARNGLKYGTAYYQKVLRGGALTRQQLVESGAL